MYKVRNVYFVLPMLKFIFARFQTCVSSRPNTMTKTFTRCHTDMIIVNNMFATIFAPT